MASHCEHAFDLHDCLDYTGRDDILAGRVPQGGGHLALCEHQRRYLAGLVGFLHDPLSSRSSYEDPLRPVARVR